VPPEPDIAALKDRSRQLWALGDYTRLATLLEPAAASLVDACAVSAGQEVLDVAAGNGNFAVAAAREGAGVVALDLSPKQVELGRARSEAEGLSIEWLEGDAEDLPFEDERFDCVGSVFGAMLTPQPDVVAREMFRVVRPGGTVGMSNWTQDGFQARLFGMFASHSPVQDNTPRGTDLWGTEELVRERLGGLAASIAVEKRSLRWQGESAEAMFDAQVDLAGPQVALRKALPEERWAEVRREALGIIEAAAEPADGGIAVDGEYLVVVARKRG
jgi:ubiquinone/menaquinone biosynthesis C-methylase UbiE